MRRRCVNKAGSCKLTTVMTQTSAESIRKHLESNGYHNRIVVIRQSRLIDEEPFVEHTYAVRLNYSHPQEEQACQRLIANMPCVT